MSAAAKPVRSRALECGFCAQPFEEDQAQPVCRACPLTGVCHHVRCPFCGYENPVPPAWLRALTPRKAP